MLKINTWIFIIILFRIIFSYDLKNEYVAVFDFEYSGINKNDAIVISELFRSEIVKINFFTVVEREKLEEILKEQALQQSGCTSSECFIKVGEIIGVNKVIFGKIARTNDNIFISVRKLDVESSRITLNVNEIYNKSTDNISVVLKRIAIKLTSPKYWCDQIKKVTQESSIQLLENALLVDSTYALAYNLLGEYYSTKALLIALESDKMNSDNLKKYYRFIDAAIKLHKKAIKYGSNPKYYYDLGFIYNSHKKDYTLSNYYFSAAIKKDTLYSDAYYQRGLLYNKKGRINEALLDLSKAIEIDNNNIDYLLTRSEIYSENTRYPEAVNDLSEAIKLFPNNSDCFYKRGQIYLKLDLYEKAVIDYTKAIDIEMNNLKRNDMQLAWYFTFRAISFKRIGKLKRALSDLNSAINISSGRCNLFELRADINHEIGNINAAVTDYKNFLSCCENEPCEEKSIKRVLKILK